jgi:iron complex transport system permease protein
MPLQRLWLLLTSGAERTADPAAAAILTEIRLPRALTAALAGALLSASGVLLQALLRNPLADPYVLGVSAGASLGAAVVIIAGAAASLAGLALPAAALAGALLSTLLVYALARGRSTTDLLLSGVVVASSIGALVTILLYLAAPEGRMQSIVLWTMGGFGESEWRRLSAVAPFGALGLAASWMLSRDLNLLSFGEESARTLGTDVGRARAATLFAAALMTSIAVALGGVIGFVGIMVPHAARRLAGPDHRALLPAAMLTGAVFLTLVDVAARTMRPPSEVPVGLLTGLLGGPFFLFLMRRKQGL